MYKITANNTKPAHGVKEYLVNTKADLSEIKLANTVASGSKAFASEEDQWYVLDLKRKWVKMSAVAGPGSGSGSGGDDSDDDGDSSEDVTYEGGDLDPDTGSDSETEDNVYEGGDL